VTGQRDRAIIFIDGNNWFHGLGSVGVKDRGRLNYKTISEKLIGPARQWIGTRYYIGQVTQQGDRTLYAQQRRFLASLEATDPRISVHLGRVESRAYENSAAAELEQYLQTGGAPTDPSVLKALNGIVSRHNKGFVFIEKAVDVSLAVDLVTMAVNDEYDSAYLLSADGDFTPAVEAVRKRNKKVYAVSALKGAQLARVVNSFINLKGNWFTDCYD
jgi:uncharacterized LabA/DUF88 family protein